MERDRGRVVGYSTAMFLQEIKILINMVNYQLRISYILSTSVLVSFARSGLIQLRNLSYELVLPPVVEVLLLLLVLPNVVVPPPLLLLVLFLLLLCFTANTGLARRLVAVTSDIAITIANINNKLVVVFVCIALVAI